MSNTLVSFGSRFGWAAVALLLVQCGSSELDVAVEDIQVTQVTQTASHSVPLIAQKATAVRVTVGVSGGSPPVEGVKGRLHVLVNGSEITEPAGLAPINESFSAVATPDLQTETDTLNFELPAPSGIGVSNDVDFRVELEPLADEGDTSNNTGELLDLSFVGREAPALFYTRIAYVPSGEPAPPPGLVAAGVGDAFVRAILPVDADAPGVYQQLAGANIVYFGDENDDGLLNGDDEDILLETLEEYRNLIVEDGVGANDRVFLYGWVGGNPMPLFNGAGSVFGRVAFGNSEHVRHQRTYAHELMHNLGEDQGHSSCCQLIGAPPDVCPNIDQVGWDVGGRLAQNPIGNLVEGRVKPLDLDDITCGGLTTEEAWIRAMKYMELVDHPVFEVEEFPFAAGNLTIVGRFDEQGTELLSLRPIFRYPWASGATRRPPTSSEAKFAVEIIDAAGAVSRFPFDAYAGEDGRYGMFSVIVPLEGQVSAVRITDANGGKVFAERARTSTAPTLKIVSPRSGDSLGPRTRVAWTATDPDSAAADLTFQLAYSHDGGRNFTPVAVGLTERAFEFDATAFPRPEADKGSAATGTPAAAQGAGAGLIRVLVSDGLNTSFADVPGLAAGDY